MSRCIPVRRIRGWPNKPIASLSGLKAVEALIDALFISTISYNIVPIVWPGLSACVAVTLANLKAIGILGCSFSTWYNSCFVLSMFLSPGPQKGGTSTSVNNKPISVAHNAKHKIIKSSGSNKILL